MPYNCFFPAAKRYRNCRKMECQISHVRVSWKDDELTCGWFNFFDTETNNDLFDNWSILKTCIVGELLLSRELTYRVAYDSKINPTPWISFEFNSVVSTWAVCEEAILLIMSVLQKTRAVKNSQKNRWRLAKVVNFILKTTRRGKNEDMESCLILSYIE